MSGIVIPYSTRSNNFLPLFFCSDADSAELSALDSDKEETLSGLEDGEVARMEEDEGEEQQDFYSTFENTTPLNAEALVPINEDVQVDIMMEVTALAPVTNHSESISNTTEHEENNDVSIRYTTVDSNFYSNPIPQ